MGTRRGNNQEQQLSQQAQQAHTAATQVNPLQAARQARIQQFWDDYHSGKDVKDIEYVRPYHDLYKSSLNANQNYAGEGLLGNNQLSGANSKMLGVIGEQLKSRRQQEAAGQLYGATQQAYGDSINEGHGIAGADTNQRLQLAGLANQRYSTYLNRPRKPSIWERILSGAGQAASIYASV